jgi:hypothetical protein
MKKLTPMLVLGLFLLSTGSAQASEEEIQALRKQLELLTQRIDELEKREMQAAPEPAAQSESIARVEEIDQEVAEIRKSVDAMSWAERLKWKGDFRYRFEAIDEDGSDSRNRSRIRARASLIADVSDTVEAGIGLATGGDDPVSSNQTIGKGGASKDVKVDLAYFKWKGLQDSYVVGGKFSNFLVRPGKWGLRWDGDWRPEGLGMNWDNGTFFAHGLGTWLEGDSRNGTEFAWVAQAGMNMSFENGGKLMFGGGYSQFNIKGRTPVYGDPDDFYGNSFMADPVTGELEYLYDYVNWEIFAEYAFEIGGKPLSLFANYTVNTEAEDNDTGYVAGLKYGAAKNKGEWDFTYFYENLEADATVGLLSDSDFGGGGTDARGHVLSGTYAFHKAWNFKATYFINEIDLAEGKDTDYDRLQLDLNFKF